MTDRELLQKAAKAVCIEGEHRTEHLCVDGDWVDVTAIFLANDMGWWNPLEDDGDALRLAVKLRLNLNFEEWDGAEYACALPHKSHQGQDEVIGDDECADARRAIVRAAAAIADAAGAA